MKIHARSLLLVAALLAVPAAAFAQDSREEQRPAGKPSPDSTGMMGGGGGMMRGRGGTMPMMDGGMPMMGMMMGMMMMEHSEGYLSFLKTELKITDAQTAQWNAFADTQRANVKIMKDMHATMMSKAGSASFPERLALHEKMMATHLDALRQEKGAVTALYGVLSDDQKKTADELLSRSMGMM